MKNPTHYIAFICLLLVAHLATAQVTTQQLMWNRFDVSLKVAPKFRMGAEINERYYVAPTAQHQLVLKTNAYYELNHGWSVFSGYTYFLQSPNDPEATNKFVAPEHRLQHGFVNTQKYGRVALVQRFQVEERFMHNVANNSLADGYRFVFRARYRMLVDIKLHDRHKTSPAGDLVLRLGNEIHLNAGKSVKGQPFDQNRAMAFLQYFINNNLSVDIGYINWYQQRNANQGFFNRHIFTTGIQAKFDLSKKQK